MRFRRTKKVIFALLAVMVAPIPAIAGCVTPPTCTDNGGIIGSISTLDINFTRLEMSTTNGFDVIVNTDTVIDRTPHHIWADVTLGNAALSNNIDVNFPGYDPYRATLGNWGWIVEMSKLTLVNSDVDTGVIFSFAGNNNEISFSNSSIYFNSHQPSFLSTAPLTINALSGNNTITNLNGTHTPLSMALNVNSGATLNFEYSGDLLNTTHVDLPLYFSTPVTGDIDNGTLRLRYSNIRFNSDSFEFKNNSALILSGSDTKIQFENVSFTDSQITQSNNTRVMAGYATLDGTTLSFNSGSRFNADVLKVIGDSSIAAGGSEYSYTGLYAPYFEIYPNITFTQNSSQVFAEYDLYLNDGSAITINGGNFTANTILGTGSTPITMPAINVNSGGRLIVESGVNRFRRNLDINVASGGELEIGSAAEFEIGPGLGVTLTGNADLYGKLTGRGEISGSGELEVHENAYISPGHVAYPYAFPPIAARLLETLTFDNKVVFSNNGALGTQTAPQLMIEIDNQNGNNGLPNDRIQYNNSDMDLTNMIGIQVDTARILTADDIDGQVFHVITSKDGSSTGSLIRGSGDPAIFEGGSIPALIAFTVSNDNTNGHDDVTLNAAKQHPSTLLTHSGITANNQANAVNLLVYGHDSGNPAITSLLNSLLNNQVSSHLHTVHAEPFASWMTVHLENSDHILNTVLDNPWESADRGFWLHTRFTDGDVDGKNDLGSFAYDLRGLVFGGDLYRSGQSRLGAFAAYGRQTMGEHDLVSQSFAAHSYHIGAYGYKQVNDWHLRFASGIAHVENDTRRDVLLGTHSESYDASFNGRSAYTGLEGYYQPVPLSPWLHVSPIASILAAWYQQNRLTESGADVLALTVEQAEAASFITGVGLNFDIGADQWREIYPTLSIKYEHDWVAKSRGEHAVEAGLAAHADQLYEFEGQHRGASSFTLGLGLTSGEQSNWQMGGSIFAGFNKHGQELGGMIKGRTAF